MMIDNDPGPLDEYCGQLSSRKTHDEERKTLNHRNRKGYLRDRVSDCIG